MEIVTIDAKTFEKMLSQFEDFVNRMEQFCRLYGDKHEREWLDNQDVCLLLNISPRTLQTLRDNKILAYTQICHKIYYKPEDIKKILSVVQEKRKQPNYKKSDI